MLIHELGHHATYAGPFGLDVGEYAAPGRLASRLIVFMAMLTSAGGLPGRVMGGYRWGRRRRARAGPAAAAAAVSGHPVGRGLYADRDVATGRASQSGEHAADRYAVSVGTGRDLARALPGVGQALLQRPHPACSHRSTLVQSSVQGLGLCVRAVAQCVGVLHPLLGEL